MRGIDVSSLGSTQPSDSSRGLNVLMIIVDDLRPDLRSFGHANAPPTPNIDAFARTARVFRRAYAQFPDCAPSRSSFLTGMRPDHLGITSHDCTQKEPPSGMKCHIRDTALGARVQSLPQYFREAHGYLALSYGKVFHQGLDDDASWSPQAEFPDGYPRGRANDTSWKTRKWFYEQWVDPKNANCSAQTHGVGSCMTEEHYGGAPLHSYVDHRTASAAVNSIWRLGGRAGGAPPGTPGFTANSRGLAGGDWAVPLTRGVGAAAANQGRRRPWFMAVGFVRPHLPFVCPRRFWDVSDDPYLSRSNRRRGLHGGGGGGGGSKQGAPSPEFESTTAPSSSWSGGDPSHQSSLPQLRASEQGDPLRTRGGGGGGGPLPPGVGRKWRADFFPEEPVTKFGTGASMGLKSIQGTPDTGFGEFRDFIPWDLRTPELFNNPKARMNVSSWRGGGEIPVASLRSDSRRAYRSCVAFVDYEIGRVLDALDESAQAKNTVVAIFSDHGWKLGEFGLWGKHSVLHLDVHVPLLLRHPRMESPGVPSHAVVELVDLFPTLVHLTGVAARPGNAKDGAKQQQQPQRTHARRLSSSLESTSGSGGGGEGSSVGEASENSTRRRFAESSLSELDGQSLALIVMKHPQPNEGGGWGGGGDGVSSPTLKQLVLGGKRGGGGSSSVGEMSVSFGELLPLGGKQVAISQYMPYTGRHKSKCMSYTVIGRLYSLKRWASHELMGRCPHDQASDLHLIYSPVYPRPPPSPPSHPSALQLRSLEGGIEVEDEEDEESGASIVAPIGFLVEASENLSPALAAFHAALMSRRKQQQQVARVGGDEGGLATATTSTSPRALPLLGDGDRGEGDAAGIGGLPKAHRAPAVRRAMQGVLSWATAEAKAKGSRGRRRQQSRAARDLMIQHGQTRNQLRGSSEGPPRHAHPPTPPKPL